MAHRLEIWYNGNMSDKKQYMKQWRLVNKERLKAYSVRYYKEHFLQLREKSIFRSKKWVAENPERKKELDRLHNLKIKSTPELLEAKRVRGREYYRKRAKEQPGFANEQF